MFLADYHEHTLDNSFDGRYPMAEMAASAGEKGITEVCFTDHVDIDRSWEGGGMRFDKYCFVMWEHMVEELEETRCLPGLPDLRLGIELGAINHHVNFAASIAATPGLDFIIGSIHNLRDETDFSLMDYTDPKVFPDYLDRYVTEYYEIAETKLPCVLGHIGYPQRYMAKQGFDTSGMFPDEVYAPLFRRLVELGVGIEVNTSGLRDAIGHTFPPLKLIKLYHDVGGEIITCGSDAHYRRDAGAGIAEGYELLRQAGFRYVTAFRQMKPEFMKIV